MAIVRSTRAARAAPGVSRCGGPAGRCDTREVPAQERRGARLGGTRDLLGSPERDDPSALLAALRTQVEDCVGALKNLEFSAEELAEIDRYATEANINLWAKSAEREGPPRK